MAKVGRNEPCPCGSGKKFKRCHGLLQSASIPEPLVLSAQDQEFIRQEMARTEAQRVQRERQQGRGKPIISTEVQGHRFVAVRNKLRYSKTWKTFHDFLAAYIKDVIGPEWGTEEIKKPFEDRHLILQWYQNLCDLQARSIREPGKVHSLPMTGAASAFYTLAYDLYCLDHNADLQSKLTARLRHKDQFWGARHEVFTAATLIRAGFEVEFEDEDDRSSSHCEFTATHKRTGRKYSVEAKHRGGNRFRIGRRLNDALAKHANYERVIFIELNEPHEVPVNETQVPPTMQKALDVIRSFEGRVVNRHPLPSAYVVITNNPGHHHLSQTNFRGAALLEGFQIADFKGGASFPSLKEAVAARDRHREVWEIGEAMRDHSNVPSTFDGQIPEFEFGDASQRLMVGERYLIERNGVEKLARLDTAVVIEERGIACCALRIEETDEAVLVDWPLSKAEMDAWRRHPDTFFGVVGQRTQSISDPVDLYEFILNSYRRTPKEKLLEFLADAIDIDELRVLDQPQLAKEYAVRVASSIHARSQKSDLAT